MDLETRRMFNTDTLEMDMTKLRPTDMKNNKMIHLPRPLILIVESEILLRRDQFLKVYRRYKEEMTNRGTQKGDMTKEEMNGLKKLKKRLKDTDLVISKTDKTGKLCALTTHEYERGGQEHTLKDKEITRQEADDIQRTLNGHTSSWAKMLNMGTQTGQEQRVRNNLITQDSTVPPMSTLVKDHKSLRDGIPRTRPVVNGNEGMNAPLNEILKDLIEKIARNAPNRIAALSTEDCLNKIDELNIHRAPVSSRKGREHKQK